MAACGPSAKFLAPAKERLVIGVLQTRFSHLEFFAFYPDQKSRDVVTLWKATARTRWRVRSNLVYKILATDEVRSSLVARCKFFLRGTSGFATARVLA